MAHLNTVVRMRADNAEQAIERTNDLITDNGEYGHFSGSLSFDWFAEDETKISEEVKTEADFIKLREQELAEHEGYLKRAGKEIETEMKGYYYEMAGECLQANKFWSTQRLAYNYADDWQPETQGNIFFVDTDRHY